MVQIRQQLGFMLKGASEFFVVEKSLFEGHGTSQTKVGGHVYCSHSALSDRAHNSIARLKNRIGGEHTCLLMDQAGGRGNRAIISERAAKDWVAASSIQI